MAEPLDTFEDVRPTMMPPRSTFSLPPDFLEEKMLLPEVWDYHLIHNAQHPLFVYESAPGLETLETITWGEAVKAQHRAGRTVLEGLRASSGNYREENSGPVGILAMSGTCAFINLLSGANMAG